MTQLIVSSGSSCHARVQITDTREKSQPLPLYRSSSPPSWVHVFSKTTANSSLRTQCAATAAADVPSPIVFYHCLHQARKKLKKQEHVLREVVVPMTQLKITTSKIDNEVIVFDGGNNNTPPIRPPNGIQWCSISVRELCTKDETRGDIGLTFPRIEGTSPFIRMPCTMALDIIGECGLPKIYKTLSSCEKLRRVALSRSDK